MNCLLAVSSTPKVRWWRYRCPPQPKFHCVLMEMEVSWVFPFVEGTPACWTEARYEERSCWCYCAYPAEWKSIRTLNPHSRLLRHRVCVCNRAWYWCATKRDYRIVARAWHTHMDGRGQCSVSECSVWFSREFLLHYSRWRHANAINSFITTQFIPCFIITHSFLYL
jgi:hypothetical protein